MGIITKKINELSLLSSPSTAAMLPIQDGDTTYKFELNNIAKTTNQGKILPGNVSGNILYIEGKAGAGTTRQGNVQRLVMGESSLALYDANLANEAWRLNIPVSVNQGGTGATDATTARTNLGLSNVVTSNNGAAINYATSANTKQLFSIGGTASTATGSSYSGDRCNLYLSDTGLFLWDSTQSSTIWSTKVSGLQAAVKDSVRFVHIYEANISISGGVGNNYTTNLTYTIPSGFSFGSILEAWPDYTGTTGGAGMVYVHSANHWTLLSGSATTQCVQFVNLSSSAVKFTGHVVFSIVRSSF